MIGAKLTNRVRFLLPAMLVLLAACGKDSTSPAAGDRVTDSMPLALGNRWEYSLEQSIYIPDEDSTVPPITAASTGRQIVNVTRTENIGGSEAFGMTFDHLMDYLFTVGADTVFERRYLAPQRDGRVLLKAEEAIYNPTGGFIPFSQGQGKPRYGTMIEVDGKQRFISLGTLAYLLSDPRGPYLASSQSGGTALASDGVESNENAILYENDYIYVYDELYKGLRWVSQAAGGVGGIDISNNVTNILDELDGYEGPIAEVEQTNALIGALGSENFKQRFYYKSGIGLIRAEISDPDFIIIQQLPNGTVFLGVGTWTFIKKLTNSTIH